MVNQKIYQIHIIAASTFILLITIQVTVILLILVVVEVLIMIVLTILGTLFSKGILAVVVLVVVVFLALD